MSGKLIPTKKIFLNGLVNTLTDLEQLINTSDFLLKNKEFFPEEQVEILNEPEEFPVRIFISLPLKKSLLLSLIPPVLDLKLYSVKVFITAFNPDTNLSLKKMNIQDVFPAPDLLSPFLSETEVSAFVPLMCFSMAADPIYVFAVFMPALNLYFLEEIIFLFRKIFLNLLL